MRFLTIFCLIFSFGLMAKDYKSLQRLNEGDVISADVLNDIMDRIELSLKTTTEEDFVGSWDVVQTICPAGALGNCDSNSVLGASTPVDDLYRQRQDVVHFKDDGDGTYSLQTENYCAFVRTHFPKDNLPCTQGFAVVDENFIIRDLGSTRYAAYSLKKISNTRVVLSMNANASASYNIIRLDKKNLPPEPPANLTATNSSGTISLSWDAVVATETFLVDGSTPVKQSEGAASSYKIQSKDAVNGTYTDLATATSNSYTDTITSGTTRWYRVYAVNEYGTSKGSNVISITYSE